MDVNEALRHADETRAFRLGSGVVEGLPAILEELGLGRRVVIVADENTYAAAGERVEGVLKKAGIEIAETVRFPGSPVLHAEYRHIDALRKRLEAVDAVPIAVGSGTINDLTKRSSWEIGRRYISVGTAVSMDGYTSAGAAIVRDGFKQTLECSAPIATVGDLEVLSTAPAKMTAAGYGDLFAKIVAGADWILADELGIDPIDPLAWRMVQEDLKSWLAKPGDCARGEREAVAMLFTGLSLTGFAMQAIHKSRPASGAEHQLSHIWEMENLEMDGVPVSHGIKVAMGSLASCALYELLMDYDIASLDVEKRIAAWPSWKEREEEITRLTKGAPYSAQMLEQSKLKHVTGQVLRERIALLRDRWDRLRSRLSAQLYPYGEMREMLVAAGCHPDPEEINLTRERAAHTIVLAQMMRNRYTVLDLAYELGLLEEWKERILSSDRYWR